jgi:hypothetical protein
MGRPERAVDPLAGPVQAFAAELRKLRQDAGSPKYLQMQRITGRSRTALAEAAGGDHLATWETVEAYVRACGGDVREWELRWAAVREATRAAREDPSAPPDPVPPPSAPGPPPVDPSAPPGKRRSQRWLVIAGVTAATSTCTAGVLLAIYSANSGYQPRPVVHATDPRPRVIVVQNKVAVGPAALTEDKTPAYLSTKLIPYCAEQGCEIAGTRMWSGAVLKVTCQAHGTVMTNENLSSAGITKNKGGVISSLWYRCVLPNGVAGYLSEVYVAPAYRGGLGLPVCS